MSQTSKQGVPPSNAEIQQTLEHTKRVVESQVPVGQYGGRLVEDVKETIGDVQQFIREKNPEEQLQKLVMDTQQMSREAQEEAKYAKKDAKDIVESARQKLEKTDISGTTTWTVESFMNVFRVLIESPELRSLLLEFLSLLQETINSTIEANKPPRMDIKGTLEQDKPTSQVASELKEQTQVFTESIASDIKYGRINVPQEKKEEINRRFDLLLRKMTRHPDVLRACQGLLCMFDQIKPQVQQLSEEVKQKTEQYEPPESLMRAKEDALSLIAQFTDRDALDNFLNHLYKIRDTISSDYEASSFFYDARSYIRKTLENPALIDDEYHNRQSEELWNRARDLINKWSRKLDFEGLLYEGRYLILKIAQDPVTNKLIDDLKALGKDLILDSRGRPSLQVTSESVQQIRTMLVPIVLENLREVPIPRIEGSTPKYDYKIENLVFSGSEVIPDNVKVKMESDVDLNVYDLSTRKYPTSTLTFKFREIKVHLRDIKFDFYRKVVPRIHDTGIADLDISGDRTRIIVKWRVTFTEIGPVFSLLKCRCHIKGLSINVKQAHHAWLYNFVTKLFHGSVKDSMEQAIENRIREILVGTAQNLNEMVRTASTQTAAFAERILPQKIVGSMETTRTTAIPHGTI
jgi:uncharacterized protein (DUF3820 family)